jgi:hypothetical protein
LGSGHLWCAAACSLALALVLSLSSGAIATPVAGAEAPVVVGPKQGERLHQYPVRIVVRSGDSLFDLKAAKLNGKNIGADFGATHGGKRSIRVSRSYGLRPGKNVLRVKARKGVGEPYRKERITFGVKHPRPLAGAGRNRRIVEDEAFKLQGRALQASEDTAGGGSQNRERWQLTRAPRRSDFRDDVTARSGGRPGAMLSDPRALKPRFTPDVPGRYKFELRASQGSHSSSDTVTLMAVPASPLVPIDTMAKDGQGNPGIQIGDQLYTAGKGDGTHQPWFQVLVLDRGTLGLVSNTTYLCDRAPNGYCIDNRPAEQCAKVGDLGCLKHDLARLDDKNGDPDDRKLVIAVNQPSPSWSPPGYVGLEPIGVRGVGAENLPNTGVGAVSAIGVPGLPQGQADAKVVVGGGAGSGRMAGYLTRDQYYKYTWLPPERSTFDTRSRSGCFDDRVRLCSNTMTVDGHDYRSANSQSGYQVEVFDGHTLAHVGSGTFGTAGGNPELDRMRDFIGGTATGNLVLITAIEDGTFQTLGGADHGAINRLADVVASAGGSKDLFLRSGANKNSHYSLVGWAGAGEGGGEETSLISDPTSEGGRLRGALMRDHDQEFRPTTTSVLNQPTDHLIRLALQPPTKWPLDGNQGAQNAMAWIGNHTVPRLGPDPRSAYWAASKDQSYWNGINGQIKELRYPGGVEAHCGQPGGFCGPDFNAARDQLAHETLLVGNVRLYMKKLAQPFAGNALSSWGDLTNIADDVTKALSPPNELTQLVFDDIFSGVLDVLAIAGAEATIWGELVAVTYTIALDYLTQARDGSDTDELNLKADEIKAHLSDSLSLAESALTGEGGSHVAAGNLGDIIVGDYAKLQAVGTNANCNPVDPSCPPEWGVAGPALQQTANAVYKSIDGAFYQAFMPLAFPAYRLSPRSQFTDPRNAYTCRTLGNPKRYYVLEGEPADGFAPLYSQYADRFDVFALANTSSVSDSHPNPATPPESITHRMFGPVSASSNPKLGGVGIYAPDFFREASEGRGTLEGSKFTYVDCGWHPR